MRRYPGATAEERKRNHVRHCINDFTKKRGRLPTNDELSSRYPGIGGGGNAVNRTSSWWSSYRPDDLKRKHYLKKGGD
tara:strand:+ start:6870 stop:7103 length:234 start_codon:yes stop_codon:yes gene_type:complete